MNKESLIKKWLAEELSETELNEFKQLNDYDMHMKVLEGAQYFKASEVSTVATIDEFYEKLENTSDSYSQKRSWYKPLLKIAAVLVVLLGTSLFFLTQNDNSFKTLASQKLTLELPDASEVVMNSKSELSFDEDEWNDKREVLLVGEAFFKVMKGASFDVITKNGKVTVLGTQFSVKDRGNFFEVTCFEGLVSVNHREGSHDLPPGSTLRIMDGIITFETVDFNRPQWLNNVSSFKSVPFYEVIYEFERQYDITIDLKDINAKRLFTGGFVHNNMEDGLKSITLPLDLTYSIDKDNNITLRNKK